MQIDFQHIDYLENGTDRQQAAYHVLHEYKIMHKLEQYRPVLAGTIPLAIDIGTSDLDILCCFTRQEEFFAALISLFGEMPGFSIRASLIRNEPSVIASFLVKDFAIEIFGQAVPVTAQMAYRHLLIEYRLLVEKGEAFRQQVLRLKQQGYKTEPAFAQLLGLTGDPYLALLQLE